MFLRKFVERLYYILSVLIFININISLEESKKLLYVLLTTENVSAEKARRKYLKAFKVTSPSFVDAISFVRVFSEAYCFRLSRRII